MSKLWEVLDTWALVKGDAEDSHAIANIKANMKRSYPDASVITAKRTVKAGGASIPVLAIVARRKRLARMFNCGHTNPLAVKIIGPYDAVAGSLGNVQAALCTVCIDSINNNPDDPRTVQIQNAERA